MHDNVNHHQDNTREHLIGSQVVVMVLRAQWPLGTIAQFFHFVAEEKKKTEEFYDWATTRIPLIMGVTEDKLSSFGVTFKIVS